MIAAGRDCDAAACFAMRGQPSSHSAVMFSLEAFFFDCSVVSPAGNASVESLHRGISTCLGERKVQALIYPQCRQFCVYRFTTVHIGQNPLDSTPRHDIVEAIPGHPEGHLPVALRGRHSHAPRTNIRRNHTIREDHKERGPR